MSEILHFTSLHLFTETPKSNSDKLNFKTSFLKAPHFYVFAIEI